MCLTCVRHVLASVLHSLNSIKPVNIIEVNQYAKNIGLSDADGCCRSVTNNAL